MSTQSDSPKLRRGLVLDLFRTQYFNAVINKRMSSTALRTRNSRKLANTQMWRYLFLGRHYTLSFHKFIPAYPRMMGVLIMGNYEHSIERLFGKTFKISPAVFDILAAKKRLPLFSEVIATGFDQIYLSWQVPSVRLTWKRPLYLSSYPPFVLSHAYVKELDLTVTMSSIEWLFDLLYSSEEILPSLNAVKIDYLHKGVDEDLVECFRKEYETNPDFMQFVHCLKLDTLEINEFLEYFNEFISKRSKKITFNLHIKSPSIGSKLMDSYVETHRTMLSTNTPNGFSVQFSGGNILINPPKSRKIS